MAATSSVKGQLKSFCLKHGADLFGVADVALVKSDFILEEKLKNKVSRAIVLGVRLSDLVLSEIGQAPTKLYFHHYKTANMFLDQLAFSVAHWIEQKGFHALAIPASQIIDWEHQRAHLSHRCVGQLAGLGWIGRNNLLVNEHYGAQFRMATVLTDANIKPDKPLDRGCGVCVACIAACPAGAIGKDRKDFKYQNCLETLKNFQKQNIVGQYICGVCVKACGGKHGKNN